MADQPADSVALTTYRFLRGGMVVMVVLLGVALVTERWHATCWQTSISAYYFTTAHTVFIGALYAIGAMLIVYQGTSDTENTLLNLAGVLTFVIATVPTTRPILLCSSCGSRHQYSRSGGAVQHLDGGRGARVVARRIVVAVRPRREDA